MPNIGLNTSIFNTTQICPQHFRNFMCGNVRGASTKYQSQNHHIQQYTNTPTVLQKLHACLLGMCMVLVPNIGISTSVSNTTQIGPQHFRNFMCVHFECARCQCQIFVLAPAYPIIHKYAHSTSETSCVSTGNVHGASVKFWSQNHHIQHYTNMPTALQKLHVCLLGMYVVLVANIGLSTTISNIIHKYAHSTSETTCVSAGNVCGASAKYWFQNLHIQHYTNMPTTLQKLHVCPFGMCVVLLRNIGLKTSIFNTTQIRPQHFRNFMCVHWECAWRQCQILVLEPTYPTLHKYAHSTSETLCVSTGNVRGVSVNYWYQHQCIQHYTNTPTVLQKLYVCPLGMCVVLVSIIGISTSVSNTTQICPWHFKNFMCVHWECAWFQQQILVLQNYHIQHYTNMPTALQKLNVLPLGMCVVLMPNIGLNTNIFNTTQICLQHFRNLMCRNVRGASTKYGSQNHHIQQYKNTPTVLQKLHASLLGICVVLVPNIGISTSLSNTTQIRPQQFRNFIMCVHWECAWCQCQILVLEPPYPTLHKYAHSTSVI